MNHHLVVWIDVFQASIFDFGAESAKKDEVRAPLRHVQRKTAAGQREAASAYYGAVSDALDGADEVLITGPSSAKLDLIKHIYAHHVSLVARVVGIETVKHPMDGMLLEYAKRYFRATDRSG